MITSLCAWQQEQEREAVRLLLRERREERERDTTRCVKGLVNKIRSNPPISVWPWFALSWQQKQMVSDIPRNFK